MLAPPNVYAEAETICRPVSLVGETRRPDQVEHGQSLDAAGYASNLREMARRQVELAEALEAAARHEPAPAVSSPRARLFEIRPAHLLSLAEAAYRSRRKRSSYFDASMFGEASWDILLDLFIHRLRGKSVSVTSACQGSDVPATTALRHIEELHRRGLIERRAASHDRRVTYLDLSDSAFAAFRKYFLEHAALFPAPEGLG